MAAKNKLSAEEQRRSLAEELWLLHFNRTLFETGLITEAQRNRIIHLISHRSSSAKNKSDTLRNG